MSVLGVLHPGQMGGWLAACAAPRGRVLWASQGRGPATRKRAEAAGLEDAGDLAGLAAQADIVLSICPPHAAEETADAVLAAGFRGLLCDANAIAPATARRIAAAAQGAGAAYVDASVMGVPVQAPGRTRIYFSGPRAATARMAALFAGSPADPVMLGEGVCEASALKMCYAGWTKGRAALLLAIRALARAEGAEAALLAEWAQSQPGLEADSEACARRAGPKAWRWVGEMEEISAAFAAHGLPAGFHQGAARLYDGMAALKDRPDADLEAALRALLDAPEGPG